MALRRASTELIEFLRTGTPWRPVQLLTITLATGTVIRTNDSPREVTVPSGTYASDAPAFKRGTVTHARGLEVQTMDLQLLYGPTDTLGGIPWAAALAGGAFDGALIDLRIGVFRLESGTALDTHAADALIGSFHWFGGEVGEVSTIEPTRSTMQCRSETGRLDAKVPRNVVQPACTHRLYAKGCGASEAAHRVAATVSSMDASQTLISTGLSAASGTYSGGMVRVTSGPNAGALAKIKQQAGGDLRLFSPLTYPLQAGDTLQVMPGCPRTREACDSVFGNGANFRGMRFVPVPETLLGL